MCTRYFRTKQESRGDVFSQHVSGKHCRIVKMTNQLHKLTGDAAPASLALGWVWCVQFRSMEEARGMSRPVGVYTEPSDVSGVDEVLTSGFVSPIPAFGVVG